MHEHDMLAILKYHWNEFLDYDLNKSTCVNMKIIHDIAVY